MYDDENRHILIQEVGPRDGLQNEPVVLSPAERAELIGALTDAGLKRIQIGSFVNPRKVPQMANTKKVWDLLSKRNGVRYLSPGLLDQLRSICVKVPDLAPLIDQTTQRIPEFLDTLRSVASKPLVSEAMSPDLDLSLKNANLAVGSVEARVRSRTGFFLSFKGQGIASTDFSIATPDEMFFARNWNGSDPQWWTVESNISYQITPFWSALVGLRREVLSMSLTHPTPTDLPLLQIPGILEFSPAIGG